eukprot:CAMPEP_0175126078 /NCGR_PEP_ID=MMETSP0087-20121206/3654_1 /TAXON_ID=136419 /ORGANISM="Unknown Unknown, Strain D1" /LENGTH=1917 /DNA_ID=CAMNT_0016407951 /DNA_START=117 /DNA_END=5871 /DNA_ORIENTATION=+
MGMWSGGAALVFTAAVLSVTLTLPQTVSCHAKDEAYFVVKIDKPDIVSTYPAFVCPHYSAQDVQIGGDNFLIYNGNLPTVSVDGDTVDFEGNLAGSCTKLDVRGQERVEMCNWFNFTVANSTNITSIQNATVRVTDFKPEPPHPVVSLSPEPCQDQTVSDLVLVPPPTIQDINPAVICKGTTHTITLTGKHFIWATHNSSNLPMKPVTSVQAGAGSSSNVADQNLDLTDCLDIVSSAPHDYEKIQHCATLKATVKADDYGINLNKVSVTNIPPVDCWTPTPDEFRVIAPPTIDSVSPPVISTNDVAQNVTLTGTNFLVLDKVLPTVEIDDQTVTVFSSGQCTEAAVKGHDVQLCSSLLISIPAKRVEKPFYPSVKVVLPNLQAAPGPSTLCLVPPPVVMDIVPPLAVQPSSSTLTITGDYFYLFSSFSPKVAIRNISLAVSVDQNSCSNAPPTFANLKRCTKLVVQVASGVLQPSPTENIADFTVQLSAAASNPDSKASISLDNLYVVSSPPEISGSEPALVCTAEAPANVLFSTKNVYAVDGVLPSFVAVMPAGPLNRTSGSCSSNPVVVGKAPYNHTITLCGPQNFTIPVVTSGIDGILNLNLSVVNPGVNTNTIQTKQLAMASPPIILSAAFPAVCKLATEQSLTYNGRFLVVGSVKPSFSIAPNYVDVSNVKMGECSNVAGLADVQLCKQAVLPILNNLNGNFLESGNTVSVVNPPPVACKTSLTNASDQIIQIDPPQINAVISGRDICMSSLNATNHVTKLQGKFLKFGTAVPTVVIEGVPAANVTVNPVSCTPQTIGTVTVQSCTEIDVTLSPATPANKTGYLDLSVEMTCGVSSNNVLIGFQAPTMTKVETLSPDTTPTAVCIAEQSSVKLTGNFEKFVDPAAVPPADYSPQFSLPGKNLTARVSSSTCPGQAIPGKIQTCTDYTLGILPNDWTSAGYANITAVMAELCSATTPSKSLRVEDVPVITKVEPFEWCVDQDVTLTVSGSGFSPYMFEVRQDRIGAGSGRVVPPAGALAYPSRLDGAPFSANNFTIFWNSSSPDSPQSGFWNMTVNNVDTTQQMCSKTLRNASYVHPKLLVFFVDPPVVYNKISLEVTVFTTGLDSQVAEVEFVPPSGPSLRYSGPSLRYPANETKFLVDEQGKPLYNRITVKLPANGTILPVGNYTVKVKSRIGCLGLANQIMSVVDTATPDLDSFKPSYMYNGESTAVTLTATANVFVDGLRAYLTPVSNPNAQAIALRAVSIKTPSLLTGVVGSGLDVGSYQLVVVNQAGDVHIFSNSTITVLSRPIPRIVSVSPAAADTSSIITLQGENFDVNATNIVSLVCNDQAGNPNRVFKSSDRVGSVGGVLTSNLNSMVFDQTASNTNTTSTLAAGFFCVVVLTRQDGANSEFSAVALGNPSLKRNNFYPNVEGLDAEIGAVGSKGGALTSPKRGTAAVVGSVTSSSRYLYVMGGDFSSQASFNATDQVEFCSVSSTGLPGKCELQAGKLPKPLAFARAVNVGRFIYVHGGIDGSSLISGQTFRAQVLNPLETTSIDIDLSIIPQQNETVFSRGGVYYYQVAAKFGPSDPINPNGESLPGEVLNVNLPTVSGASVTLKLKWGAIPNAVGYYVYRTTVAGAGLSTMTLLVETNGASTNFDDVGQATVGNKVPLIPGTLGNWKTVSATTPKWAHGYAASSIINGSFFLYSSHGAVQVNDVAPTAGYEYCHYKEVKPTLPRGSVDHVLQGSCKNGTWPGVGFERSFADLHVVNTDTSGTTMNGEYLLAGTGTKSGVIVPRLQGAKINATDGSLNTFTISTDKGTATITTDVFGGVSSYSNGFLLQFFGTNAASFTTTPPATMTGKLPETGCEVLATDQTPKFSLGRDRCGSLASLPTGVPKAFPYYSGSVTAGGRFYVLGGQNGGDLTDLIQFTTIS